MLSGAEVALGDRSNMLFQNTSVTRGPASMVVTATGMQTEMGQIAEMLTSVTRTRSPLQRELDSLTKVLGLIAWAAVAFIVVVGLARGMDASELFLLGTAMAISAIPTGLPAFVSGLLSLGAKQLAEAKAIVKNLTDVETLGATSAINTDKTGTLTMNEMMVSVIYANGAWFTVEGEGYRKTGAIASVAGMPVPDFTRLALALVLDSDADGRGRRLGRRRPDRSRAGRAGGQARCRRRGDPARVPAARRGAVRLRVQVHGHVPSRDRSTGAEHVIELVKGGPDVVLARCARSGGPMSDSQVPIADAAPGSTLPTSGWASKGLGSSAFAARFVDDDELDAMSDDPMSLTRGLDFVGMAGIIDPLRAEAKAAVAGGSRAPGSTCG